MKKTISITLIMFLCLGVFFTQVFAAGPSSASQKPKHTPQANETPEVEQQEGKGPDKEGKGPDKAKQHPGRKYNFKGEVASFDGGVLVITGKKGGTVTVDADTEIKASGKDDGSVTGVSAIKVGMPVMAQAVQVENGFLALRVHLFPNKPAHIHRVGTVTDYQPGVSITVQDQKGSTTFQIAPDVKILPTERTEQLKVGARVTIISPASANKDAPQPIAKGIVVHPEKDQP